MTWEVIETGMRSEIRIWVLVFFWQSLFGFDYSHLEKRSLGKHCCFGMAVYAIVARVESGMMVRVYILAMHSLLR